MTLDNNNYDQDEFDYEEVIETEAFIQYNAPIGPNIIVSKNNLNRKCTPRYTTTIKRSNTRQRTYARPKTMMSTSTSNRTFVKKPTRNPQATKLRTEFQNLSLDLQSGNRGLGRNKSAKPGTLSMRIQRSAASSMSNSNIKLKTSNSKSSLSVHQPPKPKPPKESFIKQRLNSAKRIQFKDMMSKFRVLETTIEVRKRG